MDVFKKKINPYIFIVIVFWVIALGSLIYGSAKESNAIEAEKQLNVEFGEITQLPQASLKEFKSFHKSELLTVVQGSYYTSIGFEDIRKYYDDELRRKGWEFLSKNK